MLNSNKDQMTKEIFIIRHGQTDYNLLGIVQGRGVDSDLNETGRRQADAFYEQYQDHPFEVVLTSTMKRTHQTVEPFLRRGLPWEQFDDIDEISWGELDGTPSSPEMLDIFRRVTQAWRSGDLDARHGWGESAAEMGERLARFAGHLRQRSEGRILVCSHGRAIRGLMCLLLDEPLREMDKFGHDNTGLYRVRFQDDAFQLLVQNDTSHLQALTIAP